ncbi:MAG: hypothetical protein ABWX76_10540 [Leifsonia flava]
MSVASPSLNRRVKPATDLLLAREAQAVTLVSGPWSLSLRGAELDDITYAGELVVRSIRLVVRDEDWGTLPMQLDSADLPGSFRAIGDGAELTLSGRAGAQDSVCTWALTLRIDGSALRVDARVEATAEFRRNRLGLIVLHPPELAGQPFAVEHPDGSTTQVVFPEHVSPHQPAHDIRGLSWQTRPASQSGNVVDSVLRFSGDIFEMEDQRNWTDASFKTYSTPLSEPFPVTLVPGTTVDQAVELRCAPAGASAPVETETLTPVRVTFGPADATRRLPVVSTSVSSGSVTGQPVPAEFGPLICELDPSTANWGAVLDRAATESGSHPLDLRLIVDDSAEAGPVFDRVRDASIAITRVGVFSRSTHVSEPELLTDVRRLLDDRGIPAHLLGGTRAHFTELNRNSDRLAEWNGPLTFSITPFMHDRGGHQLVESLAMQRIVVDDALAIAHGRPLHVGPITLGARFNAVATSAPQVPASGTLDDGFGAELVDGATDTRQGAPSLGAWVLASVAALAVPGVESVSYFEVSGSRGLIDADGRATTAAEVLGWVAELSGGAVAPLTADHPAVVGFAAGADARGESVGIVGNLSDTPLVVAIDGIGDVTLEPGAARRFAVRGVADSASSVPQ